jgi:hypothetical protein
MSGLFITVGLNKIRKRLERLQEVCSVDSSRGMQQLSSPALQEESRRPIEWRRREMYLVEWREVGAIAKGPLQISERSS